eukprot:1161658-Prorocentrum_minimum.AAC.1
MFIVVYYPPQAADLGGEGAPEAGGLLEAEVGQQAELAELRRDAPGEAGRASKAATNSHNGPIRYRKR